MKKDLNFIVSTPIKSLDVGAVTASANGVSSDLKGFHSCQVIVDADAWTDGTHTITLEESSDNSNFTTVAAADIIGSTPVIDGASDDDQAYTFGYGGFKRYVRVVTTVAGASTGAVYGALIIPGHKAKKGKLNS